MSNNSGFWSDPKVWISLFALCISFLAFFWTLSNQFEQNRRWDKLNAANIIVERAIMKRFKIVTKEIAMSTNWGYTPNIYGSEVDNQYVIPYKLIVIERSTSKPMTNINGCFTIDEVRRELERVKAKGDFIIVKHFEPKFEIRNKGKTDATILELTIDIKKNDLEWETIYKTESKVVLVVDQISTIELEMHYPVDMPVPDEIFYRIKIIYLDIHGNKVEKIENLKWISKINSWGY